MREDLSRFYEDISTRDSPGQKARYEPVPEYVFSSLNALVDGWQSGAGRFANSLTRSVLDFTIKKQTTGTMRFVSSLARSALDIMIKKDSISESYPKILQNPDLYLFLLCSPGVKRMVNQGDLTGLIGLISASIERITGRSYNMAGVIEFLKSKDLSQESAESVVGLGLDLLTQNINRTYEEKKQLAELIGKVMNPDSDKTMVEKLKEMLKQESGKTVLRTIKENGERISALVCQIWSEQSLKTERIGFDKQSIEGMKPVIKTVIDLGLSDEKSIEASSEFIEVLINMLTMDHVDPKTPTLVELTEKIFKLASINPEIKNKFSDELSGNLVEFFTCFTANTLKNRGMQASLYNEIQNIRVQKEELKQYMDERKSSGAKKVSGLNCLQREEQHLQTMLNALQNGEIGQRVQDKIDLLRLVKEYRSYQPRGMEVKKEGKAKELLGAVKKFSSEHYLQEEVKQYLQQSDAHMGVKKEGKAQELLREVKKFSIKDHLQQEEEQDLQQSDAHKDFFASEQKKLSQQKEKFDINHVFHSVNESINNSRQRIATNLKGIGVPMLRHHDLASFSNHNQEKMQRKAQENGLSQDDLNGIIAMPAIQKSIRKWKISAQDKSEAEKKEPGSKNKIRYLSEKEKRNEKAVIREIDNLLCKKQSLTTAAIVSLARILMFARLIGLNIVLNLFKIFRSRQQKKQGGIRGHSVVERLVESMSVIKDSSPDFWKDIDSEVGSNIRELLRSVTCDEEAKTFIHTKRDKIDHNVRRIFEYVVKKGVKDEAIYEPINLLLSIFTDPESYEERYEALLTRLEKNSNEAKRDGDSHLGVNYR